MRQSLWTQEGLVLRDDVEPGPLEPGWVRLRVGACGICGSDLHRYKGPPRPGTSVPGHELTGSVMQASTPLPDTLYAVEPWISCGHCDFCRAGKVQHCREGRLVGVQVPGGLADFIDAPEKNLYAVDPSLSALQGSLTEPVAVCVRAVHLARLQMDSRVLVLGAGSLGLISGLLVRDTAAQTAVSFRYPHQAEAARELGLDTVPEAEVLAWARENEPDVVIETVGGSANTLEQAVAAAKPGGRIVVLGLFSIAPALDMRALVHKELQITGSKVFGMSEWGPEFGASAKLLPRYRDEIDLLQTHQFALDDIAEAFACAADKHSQAIKVTLLP